MSDNSPQVYFSYKWGGEGERIVDAIDAALKEQGIPFVRDKADLGYKGRIGRFMQEIGRGHCVVVVICDQYLTSPNTMFELVEIARNKDVHDRIFPVVLGDADIYDAVRRLRYVRYWEDKKKELSEAMRSGDLTHLQGITDDLNLYDDIRDQIAGLTSLLKDMNTLTPEMHRNANFAGLIGSLQARLRDLGAWDARPADDAADAQASDDGSADAEDNAFEAGDEEVPQIVVDLVASLIAMMEDPQAEGLMIQLDSDDGPIDLASIVTQDDGSLVCALASNSQLPEELRLSAAARRVLVAEHGFEPPAEPGGEYLLESEPADDDVLVAVANHLLAALIEVYGLPEDRLGWRRLPD